MQGKSKGTIHRRAKKALKESEDKYRKLYAFMSEGVALHKVIYDDSGKAVDYVILDVNPAYESITGLTKDKAAGARASELYGAGEPPYLDIYAKVASTGESASFETYFPPMKKHFSISVFSPEKGEFATVFSDVTERHKTEEALRKAHDELELRVHERTRELREANKTLETEIAERRRAEEAVRAERQRFNEVLDMLPAYLVLLSPDYHVPFANRFFRERFGESHGFRCFEYLFNRTEPCEICETYKVLKTNSPLEWEWTGPDGHNYYIYDFPFPDRDGSTLIMEVGIDVTEQKKAQEALRKAHDGLELRVQERTRELKQIAEEWRTTFDSIADLVSIQDTDFKLVRVNKAYADAVKAKPGELVGRRCYEVVHGTACPIADCPHGQTLRTKKNFTKEIFEPNLGIYLEVSTSPIFDGKREIAGSVHIAKDITERKQAEEEIKQLNNDLRQRAIELEATNRELEAFSYSVSHDLRAPLRSMAGFSLALAEDCADRLDEQGKDYLRRIQSASQLMAELIEDLLALSRVTRSEIRWEPVNLSEIASAVLDDLKRTEPERQVEAVVMPGLTAGGDRYLVRLVLDNLIGNAWKFTGKRTPARIEFGAKEENGERVYFVRDNGAGFDMAYADKLFRPFQRLHSTDQFPGTGIGLATVQRITHRLGGRVWGEGKVDDGAIFYFTVGTDER